MYLERNANFALSAAQTRGKRKNGFSIVSRLVFGIKAHLSTRYFTNRVGGGVDSLSYYLSKDFEVKRLM